MVDITPAFFYIKFLTWFTPVSCLQNSDSTGFTFGLQNSRNIPTYKAENKASCDSHNSEVFVGKICL